MPRCAECGESYGSKRSLMRHWRKVHSGELWPEDEDLGPPGSDQIDLEGDEPDESGHDPEYETQNEPDAGYQTGLDYVETETNE